MSLKKKGNHETPDIIQRRIERKRRKAERLASASTRREEEVESRLAHRPEIPFGQPIVNARDRSARERMFRSEGVTFRKMEEGKEYGRRAESAETFAKKLESDPSFAARRVKELEAEQRRLARLLESLPFQPDMNTADYNTQLKKRQEQVTTELEAWRKHLENLGGVRQSKDTIKVGDEIDYYGWHKVVKVNPKSVTVEFTIGGWTSTRTVAYSDIKGVRKQGEGD